MSSLGPEDHLRAAKEGDGFAGCLIEHGRIPDLCVAPQVLRRCLAACDSLPQRADEIALELNGVK